MITEEIIKETKFFRGVDEKVYLVSNIEIVKLVTLIDTIEGNQSQLLLGDDVCGQFAPVMPEFKAFIENQVTVARPIRTIKPKNQKTSKTRRTGKTPKSQFKGVSMLQGKWRAQYYNKQTKKNEHLGSFDNEYLAAAAWFERNGNKAEAARLRALVAEHKNLNPERTPAARRKGRSRSKKTIWVCKRCGLEYQSKGKCANCGNDDMREIPAE